MPVPEQPVPEQNVWHHEDQYTGDSACSHCSGVVSHEPWCSTRNSNVRYAFQAVLYPDCLTIQDGLILHALGVAWEGKDRQATGVELFTSELKKRPERSVEAAKLCQRRVVSTEGLRETVPQEGMPGYGAPERVRMADADEPWMREWIHSVADDMMREHSYMEVSLQGSELVSVSLTEVGATCAHLLDENTEQQMGND
jgi:hypothetical protein